MQKYFFTPVSSIHHEEQSNFNFKWFSIDEKEGDNSFFELMSLYV